MLKIKEVKIRKILNSGGKPAIEASVILNKNIIGIAASPSAIIAGKREVFLTNIAETDNIVLNNLINELKHLKRINQVNTDNILNKYMDTLGSDICLSISLAFARSLAKYKNISLIEYIENETQIKSKYKAPYPLVAVFSGGVHEKKDKATLQQIMISVNTNEFDRAIEIILNIYNDIEKYLIENDYYMYLGASSGFVVKNMTTEQQFDLLQNTIEKYNYNNVSIAIDVASEHLKENDYYVYQGKKYTDIEFAELLQNYKNKYNITFVEDPFDSDEKENWISFKNNNKDIAIVGDDLFATQSQYLDINEANSIIIKMNQAGTLSKTLETILQAKKMGIKLCVSHRSYETEDTFMCDLAVAVNSEYIKIGGPRRGDRITKYNRLLTITNYDKFI